MACNLERDTIGDILNRLRRWRKCSSVAHVAPVLLQEVHQIGRVGVSVTGDDPVCLSVQMDFLLIQGTIASLRADAVAALATRLSREKASAVDSARPADLSSCNDRYAFCCNAGG